MTTLDDVKARVEAGGVDRVYKLGAVPAGPTYPYAVVSVGTPDRPGRTGNGDAADLNRATVHFFSRNLDAVLDIATKGDLDGTFVNEQLITRELGTLPYRDPDDAGVLAILHTYRF